MRDRIRPAQLTHLQVDIDGEVTARERWEPVLGIDHGASIPRTSSTRSQAPICRSSARPLGNIAWVESVSEGKPARSMTSTRRPARASTAAAADPAQRAPTIATSTSSRARETVAAIGLLSTP